MRNLLTFLFSFIVFVSFVEASDDSCLDSHCNLSIEYPYWPEPTNSYVSFQVNWMFSAECSVVAPAECDVDCVPDESETQDGCAFEWTIGFSPQNNGVCFGGTNWKLRITYLDPLTSGTHDCLNCTEYEIVDYTDNIFEYSHFSYVYLTREHAMCCNTEDEVKLEFIYWDRDEEEWLYCPQSPLGNLVIECSDCEGDE